MSIVKATAAAFSIVALTACGSETTHPVCLDQASTLAYGVKWQDDLTDAHKAGRITLERATELQEKLLSKFDLLKGNNWSSWCNFMDGVRKEGGF